jgi:osmotically-inducible protein OsmY
MRAMSNSKEEPVNERLAEEVRRALWRSTPLRALNLDQLEIEARGHTVSLGGVVASPSLKYVAERVARSVPGVREVVNLLITDEQLEREIASALSSTPELRRRRITVNATGGVAVLYGAVASEEEAEKYRSLALTIPGVVGVESRLHVLPAGKSIVLTWQKSLEGRPQPTTASGPPEQLEQPDEPTASMHIQGGAVLPSEA